MATDISTEALQQAVEEVTGNGGEAIARTHDVSSAEDWKRVVDDVLAEWGTVDILINNAGIAMAKGVLEAEIEDWNKVMAINVTGPWLGMKHVIPVMQAAGRGSIVNVSSIAGMVGGASDGGSAAYSASKGGRPLPDKTHCPVVCQGQHPGKFGASRSHRHRHDP